jgi:two-component system sensor histidine kinase KdpD
VVKLPFRIILRGSPYWLGLPLLISIVGHLPGSFISQSTLLLLYLSAVLYTSLYSHKWNVSLCAFFSFLGFNYFHTQPYFSLQMHDPDEILDALVFVFFSLLAGSISGRLNSQLQRLRAQKQFLQAQISLQQALEDQTDETVIPAMVHELFQPVFGQGVAFRMESPAEKDDLKQGMQLVWQYDEEASEQNPELETMLRSLQEQIANAVARMKAIRASKEAERRSDEEKLRSALLSSVSHDLKTPLVTMLGAATTLRDFRQDLSDDDAGELLEQIISESQRLESYIQNLLDMTRLGHGKLALIRSWVSVEEIYHVVERRIAAQVPQHRMQLSMPDPLPSLWVHAALIEQGMYNAVENALKASGKDASILVQVMQSGKEIHIRICDQGPGLPRTEWEAVFDQFYTFSLGDRYEKGTGLGLSICRSIFRVHGGDARIVDPPSGFRHCLLLTLPEPLEPAPEPEPDND